MEESTELEIELRELERLWKATLFVAGGWWLVGLSRGKFAPFSWSEDALRFNPSAAVFPDWWAILIITVSNQICSSHFGACVTENRLKRESLNCYYDSTGTVEDCIATELKCGGYSVFWLVIN